MIIAIGNIGSTSLKSKVFEINDSGSVRILGEANLDRIKSAGESTFSHAVGEEKKLKETIVIQGFAAGIEIILDWYVSQGVIEKVSDIEAMGFKTVMGVQNGAHELTPEILEEMRKYLFVAPVHNGPYLEGISEFRKVLDVPMVGVFEPSFHYSLPEYKRYLGVPWEWNELGVRRLGFHGASHRYLSTLAARKMGREDLRLVTAHLGGSSSLCAIQNGKSVDISTSFSPNSGVLQGCRVGEVDATAVLFAMKELKLSPDEIQERLSSEAGLKGLAGIGTDDCRAIEEAAADGNERAAMAIDLFVDGVRKTIAAFASTMGGLDCLVFSGGIGENSPAIRARCMENMDFMGIDFDEKANAGCIGDESCIGKSGRAEVWVLPTNEELVIAHFTRQVVESGRDIPASEMEFSLPS